MPPKPRSLSVSKQCEDCGSANPVACKSCKWITTPHVSMYLIYLGVLTSFLVILKTWIFSILQIRPEIAYLVHVDRAKFLLTTKCF